MKSFNKINKIILMTAVSVFFLASCEEDYGSRKQSTPVIDAAGISPATFTFGGEVTLTASVTDPATVLTTLEYQVIAQSATGEKILASGSFPLANSSAEVSESIFIPLVSGLADNTPVTVALTAGNVLKGSSGRDITGLSGNRPAYSRLYLVTDDGHVAELTPQAANKDKFEATGLTLDGSFNYKIAEKITSGKQVDYSGAVWGSVNGRIAVIDDKGASAFVHTPNSDYTQSFVYDNYAFTVAVTGSALGENDLALNSFDEAEIDGEAFRTLQRGLEKNQEYTLIGKLADEQIVYNLDFFERTAANKVKFLGETGSYTLYYNTFRKHVVLWAEDPAYPDYLLITGLGLGYPTKVEGIEKTHTYWSFDHIRNFILMRKTGENIFQATIYIHYDEWVGFKPFENRNWGGEKQFSLFTFTGEDVLDGRDGNDWIPKSNIDADAFYRLTINLNNNTVNVEKITL
jgi:hypothetical protein